MNKKDFYYSQIGFKHIPSNSKSRELEDFYQGQVGGRLPHYFVSTPNQRGGGLGNILQGIAGRAIPFITNLASTFLGDLSSGTPLKTAGKRTLVAGGKQLLQTGVDALHRLDDDDHNIRISKPRRQTKRKIQTKSSKTRAKKPKRNF